MTTVTKEIKGELLTAIDVHETIAKQLILKLISETDQPKKKEIEKGYYSEIQNAELLNGQENLTDNWWFDVHGENCLFKNSLTGQTLEVLLRDKDSIGDLDPYFFYNFLKTTQEFNHLTEYFKNPFNDTLNFFVELEREGYLVLIERVQFRKNK
jgi:hypothetical protein